MATRQYIGARYVPKFYQNSVDGSTQWESNVVYDPLIYVTLTNGHMYISKKEVPATVGTPASNIDYWLDVGSYDGYIEDLQNQIDTLGTAIGNLSNLTTTTKSDIVDAINEVDGDLGNLTTLVGKKEDKLNNRFFLFVGDSYGDPTIVSPNWVDFTVQYLGISSTQYANICKTAIGFIAGTGYLQQIQNYTGDKTKVTDLVLCGGLNDSLFTSPQDTYFNNCVTAMQNYVTYAKANYPNAKLWIGYIGNALDDSTALVSGTRKYLYRQWCDYVYSYYAPRYGMYVLPNVDKALCLNTLLFAADRAHPNTDGSRGIGTAVAQGLLGTGYVPYMPKGAIGWSLKSGRSKVGAEDFTYSIDGDTLHIHYKGTVIVTAPDLPSAISGGDWYEYANLGFVYFNNPVIIPLNVVLNTNTGLMSYLGNAKFEGDKIYFRVNQFDPSTHTYYNITLGSSKQVILTDFDMDCPVLNIN